MTWSVDDRTVNAKRALTMFVDAVGDEAINQVMLDAGDERYREIFRTTWPHLHARGLLYNIGATNIYFLTGEGWYFGLNSAGRLTDPGFQQKLGTLSATLKRYIKGRTGEVVTLVNYVSDDSGLSYGFIYNVVESKTIQGVFNVVGPEWKGNQRTPRSVIVVPIHYGQRPIEL